MNIQLIICEIWCLKKHSISFDGALFYFIYRNLQFVNIYRCIKVTKEATVFDS